jgi:integrase
MATTLTQAAVEKISPTTKRRWVRDGGATGLYLVVQPTGVKSWAMQFRQPGRAGVVKLHLGSVDISRRPPSDTPTLDTPLTLVEARRVAAQVITDRARGVDVIAARRAEKHRRRVAISEAADNFFAVCVRDFIVEHAKPKTRNWRETSSILGLTEDLEVKKNSLADRWSDRDVRTIDADDLHSAIEESRRHGIPGTDARSDGPTESRARKAHAALSVMFSWLMRRRRITTNPMLDLTAPSAPKARDRVLNDGEIKSLWAAADSLKEPFGSVIKLLALTGARLNEVAELPFDELAEDLTSATIPGSRTKNHLPFVLPLSPLAQSIIASQPREGQFMFSTTRGLVPVAVGSKIKSQLDEAIGISDWRIHDIRRSVATGMASIGIQPHVIEAVLHHISGFRSGVAGTYNRFSYVNEKREALEKWSFHLERLLADDHKVVSFGGRR